MKKEFEKVYQFKITLKGVKPPIWRRIQVPATYSFWDLHVALQDAMGWLDYHLHHFEVINPRTGMDEQIGIPADDGWEEEEDILPGWKHKIAKYFTGDNKRAHYVYDYGDNWEHDVQLEKILARDADIKYPVCVGGKRACPPEDCGGIWGYEDFLKIIMDPSHTEHEEMLEWAGEHFDPEHFDVNEVVFDDPEERKKFAADLGTI